MDAPVPVLWALTGILVVVTIPCLVRLMLAHPGSELRDLVHRGSEAAELLLCVGMLAMVSPLGGPIPLAGWRAAFAVAVLWLGAAWVCGVLGGLGWRASPCGHHAVSAAVMLYMLAGSASHGNDPWLRMTEHTGGLPLTALVVVAVGYHLADVAIVGVRAMRGPADAATVPRAFRLGTRHATRAAMSGSMAFMLMAMA